MSANKSTSKKALVADNVHYPIEVTGLEKRLLSTPILNRLHRVKQNSTAYLTFPAANHSRFAHSLGAMHLAGQIYSHGISNADENAVKALIRGLAEIHKVTAAGYAFRDNLGVEKIGAAFWLGTPRFVDETTDSKQLSSSMLWANGKPDFQQLGHYSVKHDSHEQWLLALGYQAVRIATMVHDLGHPPFSHVMEYALANVLVHEYPDPSAQMKHVSDLRNTEKRELHEILTSVLFCELAKDIRDGLNGSDLVSHEEFYFNCQSLELAKLLLFSKEKEAKDKEKTANDKEAACVCIEKNGEIDRAVIDKVRLISTYGGETELEWSQSAVQCLHDVKASKHIDADRLDYVIRDLLQAGLKSQGMRLGRLLQTFKLVECADGVHFLPSTTALRSIEEFFSDRLELYSAVIYHHHVVKTDLLLQLSIEALLKQAKKSVPPAVPLDAVKDINLAWQVFDPNHLGNGTLVVGQKVRQRMYPFFDDGWLFGILQHHHFKLHSVEKSQRNLEDKLLLARLEELLSGKKTYRSLVKRLQDIGDVWVGYANKFKEHSERLNSEINAVLDANDAADTVVAGAAKDEVDAAANVEVGKKWKQLKYFLDGIKKSDPKALSQSYKIYLTEGVDLLSGFLVADIGSSASKLAQEFNALDVLATMRKDRAIIPDFDLATNESPPVKFSDFSHAVKGLQEASRSMPRLFVYFANNDDNAASPATDPVELRKSFGTNLAEKQVERIEYLLKAQKQSVATTEA